MSRLALGFAISLNEEYFFWSLPALAIGLVLASFSGFNANRYVKEPRPDQVLAKSLRGFDKNYHLFNYTAPIPHVLLTPSRVYAVLVKLHDGVIRREGNRWRRNFTIRRFIILFGEEGLGNPTRDAHNQAESLHRDLAEAFGKKGIQALLIETALPEIESEANRLLGRMTDNRMHLRIESQRDTKKGDTIETLEIKISDELGTRNYELFSGGEAFRVNFALRIALSKLLARRAGAPLPTLIIDEGFGTQDSTGREKLVEAINSVQDDFEKILVITHIEELKDAFPVRIEVTKTEEGSTFSLN